jgi:hypothetical protein
MCDRQPDLAAYRVQGVHRPPVTRGWTPPWTAAMQPLASGQVGRCYMHARRACNVVSLARCSCCERRYVRKRQVVR